MFRLAALEVGPRPVYVGILLYTEQSYAVIAVVVNVLSVLRVDALYGDIDVGLSEAEPYVAHEYIGECQHVLLLSTVGPAPYFYYIRTASARFGQVDAPLSQ